MENKEFAKQLIKDIRTFYIMTRNDNYKDRLLEAYKYLKEVGVTSLEDFKTRKGLKIGAFEYDEITIFDRIQDEEYKNIISNGYYEISSIEDIVNDKTYGDQLASWGTLGYTPYREKMINDGVIIEGLTPEEKQRHGLL
ncbi:MAG: hypothetical protein IKX00_02570 [Bacilli bacterium]|nr:hypothetical protein [Bacilli bacterium]